MGTITTFRTFKVSGSSLLEGVLALTLIGTVLSFAMWMHLRILATESSTDRIQAWAISEEMLWRVERNDPAMTPSEHFEGMEASVERQLHSEGTLLVTVTCSRAGRTILVRRSIIAEP